MKMYKGFDKDLKCRDFQYEVGKTYTEDEAKLCEAGFHACEHPLDCLSYYNPGESRYCEVDLDDVTDERKDDSKRVGKKITVQGEIGIAGLVKAAVNIGIEEAKSKTTGYRAHAATTGYRAHAATTGDWAHAATTGYGAHAATTGYGAHAATTGYGAHAEVAGKESVAVAIGIRSKAKGALGCWIVCAEWIEECDGNYIKEVKAALVDGEKIKADTWYKLKNGDFVEVNDED